MSVVALWANAFEPANPSGSQFSNNPETSVCTIVIVSQLVVRNPRDDGLRQAIYLLHGGRSSPRPACGERSRASCERVRGGLKQARTNGYSPSPGDFAARRLRPLPASGARLRFTLSLRAERSNPHLLYCSMDCFAPLAMTIKFTTAILDTPPRSRCVKTPELCTKPCPSK